ncbi:MAG: HAMP domain-containing histidine kinase [Anaerolineales bacterium]|nr:HAMP domain-containing histidine kinase [Anaerolineales bacterium]
MRHHRFSHRPPWWPENEQWPPHSPRYWRRPRSPFFRRMGCLFGLFNLLGFTAFILGIGYLLNTFGLVNIPLNSLHWLFIPLGVGFVVFVIAMMIAAGIGLRRISKPLDELLEASNKVAGGDYTVSVQEKGWPEVRSLARGFNAMTEKLQVNDQQRRNMLADVSHELRNPITIMQGNLEGMIDGVYLADEAGLKSLMEETQIMARLVDDLRTLALAEAGSLQLKREAVDMAALIRETVSAFKSQADAAGVEIELSVSDTPPVEIDPKRIREVLSNLLANALRYTPRAGVVKVGLTEAGLGAERSVLVFVKDSGPGIASADLSHIFDRFYKSSDSGGMGLGLSIARHLVEAHGGKIWAESEKGKGTTISFRISQKGL